MRIIVLLSYPQSGVNAIHIVIALYLFKLACNLISVLVEMVNFIMVKVDNFCKNKLIAVYFKLFDGKYAFCFFQIRTINEFDYLDVQRYCYSNEQRDCLLTLSIQSRLWVGESVCSCYLDQKFCENQADCRPNKWVVFWSWLILNGSYNVAVSLNRKPGKTWLQMISFWSLC